MTAADKLGPVLYVHGKENGKLMLGAGHDIGTDVASFILPGTLKVIGKRNRDGIYPFIRSNRYGTACSKLTPYHGLAGSCRVSSMQRRV